MRSSLASLAGALVIFLIVVVGYGAWYTRVAEKSARVAELQQNIATKNETISRIATARATLQENTSPAHNLAQYVVAEEEVVSFISVLEEIARERGSALQVVAVSASDDAKTAPTLSFTLGIDGTFPALMQTLGAIEYAPYAISFSGLTLAKGEKSGWHAEVRMLVGSTQ
jgi:hypothetical protein